jgi:hypothetical protein
MLPDLNDVEDDVFYTLPGLGARLTGRALKDEDILIFRRPRKVEEEELSAERYYPDADEPQVFQYCLEPPAYAIFSDFDGLKQLIQELNLPNQPLNIYYSSLWRAGEYVDPSKPVKEYQTYTVETFGLKLGSTRLPEVRFEDWHIDQPSYWRELDGGLVQIWRLRIFHCTPNELGTTPSRPFSPRYPTIPYLEERWHPKLGKVVHLGGLQRTDIASAMELHHFFCDSYRILKRRRKMGRPYGTREYLNFFSFYRKVVSVYQELLQAPKRKGRPTQPEVALKMGISISSFKRYWRTTGLDWPPTTDLPK